MASPTGSVTFDKSSYRPGEVMTATVAYADSDSSTGTAAFNLTDSGGNITPVNAVFTISDPVTIAPSGSNDRTWTAVSGSDNGATKKYTAIA